MLMSTLPKLQNIGWHGWRKWSKGIKVERYYGISFALEGSPALFSAAWFTQNFPSYVRWLHFDLMLLERLSGKFWYPPSAAGHGIASIHHIWYRRECHTARYCPQSAASTKKLVKKAPMKRERVYTVAVAFAV